MKPLHKIAIAVAIPSLAITALWANTSNAPLRELRALAAGDQDSAAPVDPNAPQTLVGPIVNTYAAAKSLRGDLRTLPKGPIQAPRSRPELGAPSTSTPSGGGSAVQVQAVTRTAPSASFDFAGLNLNDHGDGSPADPNGDVGPLNYIEAVNTSVAIYDKSGNQKSWNRFNDFFYNAGVRDACATANYGDPYVLYDRYSKRWIISDFAFATPSSGPYYQCIAVSKVAGDQDIVAGGWWVYTFKVSDTQLNDYPKFASWQDGIYMTANLFTNGSSYYGAQAVAFNRSDLISGNPLRSVSFTAPYNATYRYPFSFLAANDVSATATGPEYLYTDSYGLNQWKFTTNWSTPLSSTLTGPLSVSNAPSYSNPRGGAPQLNSGSKLDLLGDRLMSAAQWTNTSTNPAVWLARTVAASGGTGILWMELTNPGNSVAVNQSGVLAPGDGLYRFMPSLAINNYGTMAVGYSTSSSKTNPSLAYAARTIDGAANTLNIGEGTLFNGFGSQVGVSRWGDYYSLSVDPTDGCTFWMTGSYMKDYSSNWQTRIIKFTPQSCGGTTTYNLGVTVTGSGTGTVTSSPIGINCPSTCAASFASGTSVTLTASASTGTFAGWSGACTGTGTCTVSMSAAKSVTATFSKVATSLAYNGPTSATRNSTITLSATLTAGAVGISGQMLRFTVNGVSYTSSSVTNGSGTASVTITAPGSKGNYQVLVEYLGNDTYAPSSRTASLKVQ